MSGGAGGGESDAAGTNSAMGMDGSGRNVLGVVANGVQQIRLPSSKSQVGGERRELSALLPPGTQPLVHFTLPTTLYSVLWPCSLFFTHTFFECLILHYGLDTSQNWASHLSTFFYFFRVNIGGPLSYCAQSIVSSTQACRLAGSVPLTLHETDLALVRVLGSFVRLLDRDPYYRSIQTQFAIALTLTMLLVSTNILFPSDGKIPYSRSSTNGG